MNPTSSLELWKQQGENLLVVQPFMDRLIVRGDGCYLVDADGRRVLDLAAGQFCSILGHNHPRFTARLREQLDTLVHLGDQYVAPVVLQAAQRLASITPVPRGKVLFLSTGSEANECAMRMAKAVTGRTGMLAFSRGYYGISLATRNLSSISDHPGKVDFQPAPIEQYKLLSPDARRCPVGIEHSACTGACLSASFELLGEHRHNIAAVIVEPVLSAGGMIFPSKEYLTALHARSREIGALFVVDEAQTGLGRCGEWFDIQNHQIEPDIVVVSKTAGNGYPIGAVVASESVATKLESQGFGHLSSHQNDPLAAAAVHAVIDIVEEERLIEHSRAMGEYFMQRLQVLQRKHPLIVDVRGRGLMIGMELNADDHDVALRLALLCEQRDVHLTYTYYEPVVRFIPPLVITTKEIDAGIAVLDDALGALEGGTAELSALLPRNVRSGPYLKHLSAGVSPMRLVRGLWNNAPKDWLNKLKKL
jgi:2,2-dialkylglycine decarboxylase (pyruvate)